MLGEREYTRVKLVYNKRGAYLETQTPTLAQKESSFGTHKRSKNENELRRGS
jgi:hypothetical protein